MKKLNYLLLVLGLISFVSCSKDGDDSVSQKVDIDLLEGQWILYSENGKILLPYQVLFECYEKTGDGTFDHSIQRGYPETSETLDWNLSCYNVTYKNNSLHYDGIGFTESLTYKINYLDDKTYIMEKQSDDTDSILIEMAVKIDPPIYKDSLAGAWEYMNSITSSDDIDLKYQLNFDDEPQDPANGQGTFSKEDMYGSYSGRFHLLGNLLVLVYDDASKSGYYLYPKLSYEASFVEFTQGKMIMSGIPIIDSETKEIKEVETSIFSRISK